MAIVGTLRNLFGDSLRDDSASETLAPIAPRFAGLLPARCLLCADTCANALCAPCDTDLRRTGDESCPRCRLPSSNGEVCGRCLRFPPQWDRLAAMFWYQFPLDRLIVGAKHARFWNVFDWAANSDAAWPFASDATLIPVPASAERIEERGYNQATLLARALAKRFSLHADNDAIVRIRATATQANRNWIERRHNVKDAFAATRSLAGESVVLVDDVLTTGATLNECAKAALAAGASRVDAYVIARVNPPRSRDRVQQFNRAVA
ncbi:MAG: phosphoribosyltransferase family protein [Casimicrobium sp.]